MLVGRVVQWRVEWCDGGESGVMVGRVVCWWGERCDGE